jgi:hypothetical protein
MTAAAMEIAGHTPHVIQASATTAMATPAWAPESQLVLLFGQSPAMCGSSGRGGSSEAVQGESRSSVLGTRPPQ